MRDMSYHFQTTGDAKIDRIIKQFDSQIKKEIKEYKDSTKCPSYMHKELFLMNLKMSYDDWRLLRDEKYRAQILILKRNQYDELCYKYKKVKDFMRGK